MKKRFIVKIQTPLATNATEAEAMVYNEDRDVQTFLPLNKDMVKKMGGESKQFFWASLVKNQGAEGYTIHIHEQAKWQEW